MAEIDQLMTGLLIELPGATVDVVRFVMFEVMDEWFRASNSWKEDITFAGNIDLPSQVYTIVPTFGQIDQLVKLVNEGGTPVQASMEVPGTVVPKNTLDDGVKYTATVTLTVELPTTKLGYPDFPDWVLVKYMHEIKAGVLGKMMAQQGKTYSNVTGAGFYLKKFEIGKTKARVAIQQGNLYGGQRWTFPQSFMTNSQRK